MFTLQAAFIVYLDAIFLKTLSHAIYLRTVSPAPTT
jgi:hypothetical protein